MELFPGSLPGALLCFVFASGWVCAIWIGMHISLFFWMAPCQWRFWYKVRYISRKWRSRILILGYFVMTLQWRTLCTLFNPTASKCIDMHSIPLDWRPWSRKSEIQLPADLDSYLFELSRREPAVPKARGLNATDWPGLGRYCAGLSVERANRSWLSMCLVPSLGRPSQFFD